MNSMLRRGARLVVCGAIAGSTIACDLVREGDEGNFYFRYDHPGVWAVGTPIASGTEARLIVLADEEGTARVPIQSVRVEGDAFEVSSNTQGHVVLRGMDDGEARLVVTEVGTGLTDSTTLRVRDPDTVSLRFPNPFNVADEGGVFVAGGSARVPYDLRQGDTLLIGYGFAGFSSEPTGHAVFTGSPMEPSVDFLYVNFPFEGTVTLQHPLASEPLEVEVVSPSTLATLAWRDFGAGSTVALGTDVILFLEATLADETMVFGLDELVAVSATSSTCTITPSDLWGDGTYILTPVEEGECAITATYGTLESVFAITVEPRAAE